MPFNSATISELIEDAFRELIRVTQKMLHKLRNPDATQIKSKCDVVNSIIHRVSMLDLSWQQQRGVVDDNDICFRDVPR